MEIIKTPRGFEYIEFRDRYGYPCTLQQSSLADNWKPGSSAIWFGRKGDERMHLDIDMLNEIMLHLQAWLDTGSFKLK